jgi:hypothetical protein
MKPENFIDSYIYYLKKLFGFALGKAFFRVCGRVSEFVLNVTKQIDLSFKKLFVVVLKTE